MVSCKATMNFARVVCRSKEKISGDRVMKFVKRSHIGTRSKTIEIICFWKFRHAQNNSSIHCLTSHFTDRPSQYFGPSVLRVTPLPCQFENSVVH
ncbi:MAG: hypothetical protein LH631_05100 [Alkalinema sp. CAN_BIN05]|nr:hypothetical protein [Alkalinema sp. CAN_BIN05]